jgi:hypothetical protein
MPFSVTLIIRLALSLLAVALAIFIVMAAVVHSGWVALSKLLFLVGSETLLAGFSLLVLLGLSHLFKGIVVQLRHYFSASARAQRRVWFNVFKQDQRLRVHAGKMQQYLYFAAFKRKRLLQANDSKHSRVLAKVLQRDLKRCKKTLSKPLYTQWQKQLTYYASQHDVDNLLKLQQYITTHINQL